MITETTTGDAGVRHVWTKANKVKVYLDEMDDGHLGNAIRKIKRDNWNLKSLPFLEEEARKRGLKVNSTRDFRHPLIKLEVFSHLGT